MLAGARTKRRAESRANHQPEHHRGGDYSDYPRALAVKAHDFAPPESEGGKEKFVRSACWKRCTSCGNGHFSLIRRRSHRGTETPRNFLRFPPCLCASVVRSSLSLAQSRTDGQSAG